MSTPAVYEAPTIRAVIVDDERLARRGLRRLLERQPGVTVVAECADGADAVRAIRELRPDLLLLDVQMPGMSGLDVLAAVGADAVPATVFVTAFDTYAVRAFDANAVDYLLKPVDPARFQDAFDRVSHRLTATRTRAVSDLTAMLDALRSASRDPATAPDQWRRDRIVIRGRERAIFVDVADITWVEAAGNYVRIHTAGRAHTHRRTMDQMQSALGAYGFVRVRRSALVQRRAVVSCEPYGKGSHVLMLRDGTRVVSSRAYLPNVRDLLTGVDDG